MTYEELSLKHRPPPLDLRLAFGCVCGWRIRPGVKAWTGTLGFSEGQHTAVFECTTMLIVQKMLKLIQKHQFAQSSHRCGQRRCFNCFEIEC